MANNKISVANTEKPSKGVNLAVPGEIISRIRNLQPLVGRTLGLRTKAPQYMVISEAIGLMEKKASLRVG